MWEPEEEEKKHEEVHEEEEEAKERPAKQLKLIIDPDFERIEDVSSIEWVNVRPFILPQGRETYKKAPKPPKGPEPEKKPREAHEEEEEEDKREEPEEEEEAAEEGVELFGGSTEDEPIRPRGEEDLLCWSTKTVVSPIEGRSFQVTESVRWPGAFNMSDGKRSCSLYYGIGNKFVVNGFQPPKPPPIAKEYRRKMTERADPTMEDEKEVEKMKHPPEEEDEGQ
jgi:ribosomal protein L12E/L44/L45/RPP1/RPP2